MNAADGCALPRRIYLDCDYFAFPLWEADGDGACCDPRLFSLSDELVARLESWASAWDDRAWALLDAEDEHVEANADDRRPDPQDLAHEQEGVSLWLAVREELAGRHEVGLSVFAAARGVRLVVWTPEEYEALKS